MASSTDLDLSSAAKARELLRERLLSPPSSRKSETFSKNEQKSWPDSRRTAFRSENIPYFKFNQPCGTDSKI
jgi:hypothetical protein